MAPLDSEIDALYQKPLDEFTSARNALAKTLAGADAARVRKLPKPTVVPWAINQLYWRVRPVFDRLRTAGERLRAAQIAALKGRAADVRDASDAQRKAIAAAVQQAVALAEASGSRPNLDELTRTLEALSLAPKLAEDPGRLTRPLQPAGFEALAGVQPAPQPRRATPTVQPHADRDTTTRAGAARESKERQAKEREAKERRERERAQRLAEAELHRAEATLDRAKAAETQARAAWERSQNQVKFAERAVAEARRALDK